MVISESGVYSHASQFLSIGKCRHPRRHQNSDLQVASLMKLLVAANLLAEWANTVPDIVNCGETDFSGAVGGEIGRLHEQLGKIAGDLLANQPHGVVLHDPGQLSFIVVLNDSAARVWAVGRNACEFECHAVGNSQMSRYMLQVYGVVRW